MQQLKDSASMGDRSLQVHTALTLYQKQVVSRANKGLFRSNGVNARTCQAPSCRHECPNHSSCNKVESLNPPDCCLCQCPNPFFIPEPSEEDVVGMRKRSRNYAECPNPCMPERPCLNYPGSLFMCRNGQTASLHKCQWDWFSSARGHRGRPVERRWACLGL